MMGRLDGKVSGFAPSLGLQEVSCEDECDLRGLQPLLVCWVLGRVGRLSESYLLYRNEINTGLSPWQAAGRHYCSLLLIESRV